MEISGQMPSIKDLYYGGSLGIVPAHDGHGIHPGPSQEQKVLRWATYQFLLSKSDGVLLQVYTPGIHGNAERSAMMYTIVQNGLA
jgi:hypothetical protein